MSSVLPTLVSKTRLVIPWKSVDNWILFGYSCGLTFVLIYLDSVLWEDNSTLNVTVPLKRRKFIALFITNWGGWYILLVSCFHLPSCHFAWKEYSWRYHCSFVARVNVYGTCHATPTRSSFSCGTLFSPTDGKRLCRYVFCIYCSKEISICKKGND